MVGQLSRVSFCLFLRDFCQCLQHQASSHGAFVSGADRYTQFPKQECGVSGRTLEGLTADRSNHDPV